MTLLENQVELTNWSKSARSPCYVHRVQDLAGIVSALAVAQAHHLSVIAHGAGHSYTDAALNTGGVVIDVSPMRRILSWDAAQGIMCVEPGATLQDVVQMAWKDGWWPMVAPSTPAVTMGGCAAMNVNGKNAWKDGPFGAAILSLDVLLASGEERTLLPERDTQLFHAFVGSMGLLGIISSISIQLRRMTSGYVTIRRRSATSLDGIFNGFAEEEKNSDYMEAWLDGFAEGGQLGRGILTSATIRNSENPEPSRFPMTDKPGRLEIPLVRLAARVSRPLMMPAVQMANRTHFGWGGVGHPTSEQKRALFPYTFWPSAAIAGYYAMFPEGVETFQAFVPGQQAKEIFKQVVGYSQQQGCRPIWCILKQHRRDPFLLSYQVDGFSLELNYPRTHRTAQTLKPALQHMIAIVIEAGGRFYLAKDHFLTHAQYRQSIGGEVVDTFLHLKRCYDPETLLQSDLFRRVFQPSEP